MGWAGGVKALGEVVGGGRPVAGWNPQTPKAAAFYLAFHFPGNLCTYLNMENFHLQ